MHNGRRSDEPDRAKRRYEAVVRQQTAQDRETAESLHAEAGKDLAEVRMNALAYFRKQEPIQIATLALRLMQDSPQEFARWVAGLPAREAEYIQELAGLSLAELSHRSGELDLARARTAAGEGGVS